VSVMEELKQIADKFKGDRGTPLTREELAAAVEEDLIG